MAEREGGGGGGGGLLLVGVEFLDAVVDFLVAQEDGGDGVLEGSGAFTLGEDHGVVLEVEGTALVVDVENLEDDGGGVEGHGAYELAFLGYGYVGVKGGLEGGKVADHGLAEGYLGGVYGDAHGGCVAVEVSGFAFVVSNKFLAFHAVAGFVFEVGADAAVGGWDVVAFEDVFDCDAHEAAVVVVFEDAGDVAFLVGDGPLGCVAAFRNLVDGEGGGCNEAFHHVVAGFGCFCGEFLGGVVGFEEFAEVAVEFGDCSGGGDDFVGDFGNFVDGNGGLAGADFHRYAGVIPGREVGTGFCVLDFVFYEGEVGVNEGYPYAVLALGDEFFTEVSGAFACIEGIEDGIGCRAFCEYCHVKEDGIHVLSNAEEFGEGVFVVVEGDLGNSVGCDFVEGVAQTGGELALGSADAVYIKFGVVGQGFGTGCHAEAGQGFVYIGGSGVEVGFGGNDVNGDVVDDVLGLVDAETVFLFVVDGFDVGIGGFEIIVGEGIVVLAGVSDGGCRCVVVVVGFGIEFVGGEGAGEECGELLAQEHLLGVFFQGCPGLLELLGLFGLQAVFLGIECVIVEHLGGGESPLLYHAGHHGMGCLTNHGFGKFVVGYNQSESLVFLLEEGLVNHLLEYHCLDAGVVDVCVALIAHLFGLLLHAALELDVVDFLAIDFCNCVVVGKQFAGIVNRGEDKQQKRDSEDGNYKAGPLSNLFKC